VSTYYDRPQHMQQMIQTAMAQDYSWEKSTAEYEALYERALAKKRG
jgi:starch synthase